jgi:hypothetical protein
LNYRDIEIISDALLALMSQGKISFLSHTQGTFSDLQTKTFYLVKAGLPKKVSLQELQENFLSQNVLKHLSTNVSGDYNFKINNATLNICEVLEELGYAQEVQELPDIELFSEHESIKGRSTKRGRTYILTREGFQTAVRFQTHKVDSERNAILKQNSTRSVWIASLACIAACIIATMSVCNYFHLKQGNNYNDLKTEVLKSPHKND